jgi:hypothetical protein
MVDRGILYDNTTTNDKNISLSKWAPNMPQKQKNDAHTARCPIQRTDYPVG